ncbi:MAG: helix-turn-helix domain-containing protein [Muribaculaceae bacterium]|nr:helix-turn-helix domain-containing protein [Muribaculaceae bacterium]
MQENNEESPIIQRLKQFIAHVGLSSTQFADRAGIPRPTFSQMLNGRNKSIGNQVLAKLDEKFPELDIVWLLFGRGDMLNVANIETSEHSESRSELGSASQASDVQEAHDEPYVPYGLADALIKQQSCREKEVPDATEGRWEASVMCGAPSDCHITERTIPVNSGKRISSIIVLYSDNSFETFSPASEN